MPANQPMSLSPLTGCPAHTDKVLNARSGGGQNASARSTSSGPATLADVHDCDAMHEMALPADPWNDPDPVVFVAAWMRESGLALAQDDEEAAELLHAVGRMATDLLGSRAELAQKRRDLAEARAFIARLEARLDHERALRDAA